MVPDCIAPGYFSKTFIDKLDVFRYHKFEPSPSLTVFNIFQKEIADSFRRTEIFYRSSEK